MVSSASYGPPGRDNLAESCDATARVASVCTGRSSCAIPIRADVCASPPDRLHGLLRALTVTYTCGAVGHARLSSDLAPFELVLACR